MPRAAQGQWAHKFFYRSNIKYLRVLTAAKKAIVHNSIYYVQLYSINYT